MAWNEESRGLDKTVADRALTVDDPWRPTTRAGIDLFPTLTSAATLDAFRDTGDGEFVIMAVVDSHGEVDSGDAPPFLGPMEDTVRVAYESEACHRTSHAHQARRSRVRELLRKDVITPGRPS